MHNHIRNNLGGGYLESLYTSGGESEAVVGNPIRAHIRRRTERPCGLIEGATTGNDTVGYVEVLVGREPPRTQPPSSERNAVHSLLEEAGIGVREEEEVRRSGVATGG